MKGYAEKVVEVEETVTCLICEKKCSSQTYLKYHLSKVHEGKKPQHDCFICERKFYFKSDINQHMLQGVY